MDGDKAFLTYNQQMKHLRSDKSISCHGTEDKVLRLQEQINPIAFGNVRGQLGVKDLLDLQKLKENPRIIPYNKF